MTPLVTIGIPCFNAGQWLRGAIESALAQTYSPVEVIVVDDGSTDDSLSIARAFGERVRCFANEGKGATAARNIAWREARGEWLQFLDADDYLEPDKVARQFTETDGGRNADIIYSTVWWETWRGNQAVERHVAELNTTQDLFTQWFTWQLPQTGGALWRKSALDALGGWKTDQPCCQEHELYARALRAGQRFVFAPTPLAVYRQWSDQTLCRRDPSLVIEVKTRLIDEMSAWLRARGEWRDAHAAAAGRACFEMARSLANEDLAKAAVYHRQRREAGLIATTGPAAPAGYRLFYHLLGFQTAERLAILQRRE